jgi:hypothetical protein
LNWSTKTGTWRFNLTAEEDFQHFKQSMVHELAQIEFISADGLEDTSQQDRYRTRNTA